MGDADQPTSKEPSLRTEVVEVAAVARPDPVLGEKVHVFVARRTETLGDDEIRRFCRERLADYKVPDFVTFLPEGLPRNPNGKILKRVLRDMIDGQRR